MSYVRNTLLPNEKLLYVTKPHYMIFGVAALLIILAIVVHIVMENRLYDSLALFVSSTNCLDVALRYFGAEDAMTDKRVLMKKGLISRQEITLTFTRVEEIYVTQGLLGRVFNFGTIVISGIGGIQNRFTYVPNPHNFRNLIQQHLKISA